MILFNGEGRCFKNIVKTAKNYFEFGCGASTHWVLKNTDAKITCVDGSQEWLNTIPDNKRLTKIYVDIGPLRDWGIPINDSMKHNWHNYYQSFDDNADVVLIDGRFRVACFLNVLNKSRKGTIIIFDDYVNRDYYHTVEKYIKINKICERQAIFIKSNEIVPDDLIKQFENDVR